MRVEDRAVAFGQFGMTFGVDAVRIAVINDPVGLENAALVIDPRIAFGRDGILVLVVDEFIGLDEHFRVWVLGGGLCFLSRRRCLR